MSTYRLGKYLAEEGLLPPDCRNVELLVPASGALALRFEVFITPENLPKVARALARLAEPMAMALDESPF